jgi:tRNA(Ile)-lysidine synthetase-like protein
MKSFEALVKTIKPGRYVVGVSGGVDSVVLLEVLRKLPELELIVAHFDHGIRKNSQQDRKFVQTMAMSHNLQFEFATGNLKHTASEATARDARYMFLRHTCNKYNAAGIITAHHQDDLLETAIINLLRGTGRRGLNSLRSHPRLLRPMLDIPKAQIIKYAKELNLQWRDDPTNLDPAYLRNHVRHIFLATINNSDKKRLLEIIVRQKTINQQIDAEIQSWLNRHVVIQNQTAPLPRYQLTVSPQVVAYEILQTVCKVTTGKTVERRLAERALLFAKTAMPQKLFVLNPKWQLRATPREVIVEPRKP